nr:thiolase family protein [uncultured Brevundimonas sp.]
MSHAYVVGIDMLPFGRFPDRPVADLAAEAALLALDEASLGITDIQALYCGTVFSAQAMLGQQILGQIGQTGIPVTNCVNACASGATAFREGVLAVTGGHYDLVLAVGAEKMGSGLLGETARADGFVEEGALGSFTTPALFAMIGVDHARRYGTRFEQFAQVAVKNHHHATLNPKAMYRRETPLEEVMAAEMIAWPNTKLMCSVNVDGAAAAVIASEGAVRRLGLWDRAVRVRASEMASGPFTSEGQALTDFNAVTRLCARRAYERAGVDPADLSLVELHDCFATAEIVHYENLLLCGPGEAGALIDGGDTAIGGRIPVNLSGGLLSKGHPLGATGIANIYEVCLHLRSQAGARQVPAARLGLTHVAGGGFGIGSTAVIHVLEKT